MKLRKSGISSQEPLPVSTQCQLIEVCRASYYVKPEAYSTSDDDLLLMRLIVEEYTLHPFYGSRRMRQLGLAGMAPGPNTSKPHPDHNIYLYLLRGVSVTRPCSLPATYLLAYTMGMKKSASAWTYAVGAGQHLRQTVLEERHA